MSRSILTIAMLILLAASATFAASDPSYSPRATIDTVPFYPDGQYDESVPKPNDFLEHPIGQWAHRYTEMVAYLKVLDTACERVSLQKHGESYEGRDLYNVFISAPAHIRKLGTIRKWMDKLADPREPLSAGELDELVANTPAVAWMGYCVHGEEISGVDAAIQLIYQLAAGTDPATMSILDSTVVIVDPSQNPDGRERYLSMLQSYQSAVPNYNQRAMQHNGVWPWGRANHYLFDLNRDWILLRQKETVSKVATIVKWHPQIVVDAHEMGSNATFLFSPPRQPINHNIPDHYMKWMKVFADDQAAAFDQRAWSYYTGEWHEQWYPGYGSAWPTYSGGIGILYEMAGVDGHFVKQQDDYLLSYHEAVNKHFTSSLANLTTLVTNRRAILRDYYNTRKQIVAEGRRSKLAYLFKPNRDELKMKRFVESLTGQGIEVTRATADFKVATALNFNGVQKTQAVFPQGTYIVSTAQPMGALAKGILEFDPRLSLDFLKEERREIEKHGDTRMYEISAWSPALAYDMDAWQTTSTISAPTESVIEIEMSEGKLHNPDAQFGFVIDMVGEKTNRMLVRLFQDDLVIRASEKAFTIEGHQFTPGSLVLLKRGNRDDMPRALANLASEIGLDIFGVNSGNSSQGSLLGAPTFRLLRKPRVGILAGNGVDYTSFGSLWYALDQELEIPHSLVNLDWLHDIDLSQYNVLVAPSSWGPFFTHIGDGGGAKIKKFVEDGGTLICMGNSAVWATDSAKGISQVRTRRQVLDKLAEYDLGVSRERQAEAPVIDTMAIYHPEKVSDKEEEETASPSPSLEKAKEADEWARKFHPRGVIMRATLDTEDWLAFGMGESVPVMIYSQNAFMAKGPVKTTARLANVNDLRLSGLLWPEARQRWANTAYTTREKKGKGQIILFAADPNMRAYFYGSRQLFVNALLYGPGMGSRFDGPYD